MMSFGKIIRRERQRQGLSLKTVAERVLKEDGQPITPQYLNDIEHERRHAPSPYLIGQIAKALGLAPEVLYYIAGQIPTDLANLQLDEETIIAGYKALRKVLTKRAA